MRLSFPRSVAQLGTRAKVGLPREIYPGHVLNPAPSPFSVQPNSLPRHVAASLFVGATILLEWLSVVLPFGTLGLVPWHPSMGLSFFFALMQGRRSIWLVCAAQLLSIALVRGAHIPALAIVTETALRTILLYATIQILALRVVSFSRALKSVHDLFILLSAAAIVSGAVSILYVTLLAALELLNPVDLVDALLTAFVGDLIGIAVIAPLGLMASFRLPIVHLDWKAALQLGFCVSVAAVVALFYARTNQLQLFYLLFLPVTWIAVRSGIEGVSVGLLLIQVVLFLVLLVFGSQSLDLVDFQARMLILAATGLFAGALVTERRIAEAQLRLNQDALSNLSRIGSMGELSAAIAHEINQPLSAAGTYTRMVAEGLRSESLHDATLLEMAEKGANQIARAADVVRRLRALVRIGKSELRPRSITRIVQEAIDVMGPELTRHAITLRIVIEPQLPQVSADRLQVEQVLLNLMRNSMEAIVERHSSHREITIQARARRPFIEIQLTDTGKGFAPGFDAELTTPLSTTKADGMGIGLSLCRSIVVAHAGQLRISNTAEGASVTILLPVGEGDGHGS